MSSPSRGTRPARGGDQAHERAQEGGLAHAVVAEDADRAAAADFQRDPVQNADAAVARLQALAGDHASASRAGTAGGLAAEIDVAHYGIVHHALDLVLDQDAALVQDGDGAGDHADELHVVLDHDQGVPVAKLVDEGGGAAGLLRRHAGGGLVEEDEVGLGRHHHRKLDQLAGAVGEPPDLLPGHVGEPQPIEHRRP